MLEILTVGCCQMIVEAMELERNQRLAEMTVLDIRIKKAVPAALHMFLLAGVALSSQTLLLIHSCCFCEPQQR